MREYKVIPLVCIQQSMISLLYKRCCIRDDRTSGPRSTKFLLKMTRQSINVNGKVVVRSRIRSLYRIPYLLGILSFPKTFNSGDISFGTVI